MKSNPQSVAQQDDRQDPQQQSQLDRKFDADIWDIETLASYLKVDRRNVYALTRGSVQARSDNPLPFFKLGINKGIRFRRSDVLAWVNRLAERRGRNANA